MDGLSRFIDNLYERNPHVGLLGMRLESGDEKHCIFSMELIKEIHGNAHNQAHGGALVSLADTTMGAGCAFFNKKVVTLNIQMSYFSSAPLGSKIYAKATVLHNGRTTIGVEADIVDEKGKILAKSTGTFFVIGKWVEE